MTRYAVSLVERASYDRPKRRRGSGIHSYRKIREPIELCDTLHLLSVMTATVDADERNA